MVKITFIGAGSTAFAKNVLGDALFCDFAKQGIEIALYDIDGARCLETEKMLNILIEKYNNGLSKVKSYVGVENRKDALKGADFIVNAIQVGRYKPCTVIDFEIPSKYGLQQTIGDTMGIGGIFRGLRSIQVLREIAADIEEVAPKAWLLNYTNPMSIISNFFQRYTNVKAVGLCHSVQHCSSGLLKDLGIESDGIVDKIAGINHMGWLLEITDSKGNDIYPEIKKRAAEKNATEKHNDMVRYEYIKKLGYYVTESSVHSAEYTPFFIKSRYPELLERFNITIGEYLRRCEESIKLWEEQSAKIHAGDIEHTPSIEYATSIMQAMVSNVPFKFGGNVLNKGSITNLPSNATVEVPCIADGSGVTPMYVGDLPLHLAAMNSTNIYPQLLTVEAAVNRDREMVYRAAMMEPHTAAELS
ncbi:MAG: alpha-glucosidase/alpha-galactosidase, partial [Bacteroidales bacterium]|nr:alpha-glucosidase/alpha-galactosidase [Bacteroidales bacterium]